MFPWIVFLKERKKRLSDIEYLAIKEFGGKLVQNDNSRTTTGDLATLTAASGKDMYLVAAKINMQESGAGEGILTVQLKINAVVIEEWQGEIPSTDTKDYEFISKGFKVAATQTIKLEVTAITGANVEGQLICFEETTGDSPAV